MRIVQINDDYIDLLIAEFPSVMESKRFHRSHTRKYIGIIFTIGKFNYYVPFSSPKFGDYNLDGTIKKNNIFSIKMTKNDFNGRKALLGTLKFNNMIPVPMAFVEGYSIEGEADKKYRDIVKDEFEYINKNQTLITKTAKHIYNFKLHEKENKNVLNAKQYNAILPFDKIEDFLMKKKMI